MIKTKKFLKDLEIITIIMVISCTTLTFANLEDNEMISTKEIQEEVIETGKTLENRPKLNARIGLIYDRASGRVLYEKNGNKQTPMASTTKIMTAIVVMENCDLKEVVTIESKAAGIGGSRLGLRKNDEITVHDLLYGLMLRSGNDAAVALAIYTGGSVEGFADMMNRKAKEMGLVHSHFIVPHGLDMQEHYTTAYELARMADYALDIPKIKEIVGTKSYTITINGKTKVIRNTNELLGTLNGVYGIKTGFTNGAGRCLVTACKRGNLDIITVVLGADTKKIRTTDSIKLIEYANKNYQIIDIKQKVEKEFAEWKTLNKSRITINKGVQEELEIALEELPYKTMAIQNTETDNITMEISTIYYIEAPVEEKKIVGNVRIKVGNEIVEVLDIYNKEKIRKKEIGDYMIEFLKLAQ